MGISFIDGKSVFWHDAPMARPLKYPESRIVRLPEGTLARIDALRGDDAQGEWLRQFVLQGLLSVEKAVERSTNKRKASPDVE